MSDLLDKKLLFITGKGGVGKTSVATGLAYLASNSGKQTLVCEVDPKGDLARSFECARTPYNGVEINENLKAMSMDTETSLREYLRLQLKVPVIGRIGPVAKAFEFVSTAAPGVREILTVGKFLYEVKNNSYDLIIVDASPTGHIVSQLAAPQALRELVKLGPVKSQTEWMIDILGDPDKTGAIIVTTTEEMPVNETIELSKKIESETNVHLSAVIINQVLPELFSSNEEAAFLTLFTNENMETMTEMLRASPETVMEAARLAVTLRRMRSEFLEKLRDNIDSNIPQIYLPYRFNKLTGLKSVKATAAALADEIN